MSYKTILQSDLDQISKWLVTNKLFLNINKTKSMLIGNRQHRDIDTPLKLKCGGKDIAEVNTFKYLGILLDKHLNFEAHSEYISNKVSKRLGSLARSRKFMTTETSLKLYKSLVVSLFDYCDTVYMTMNSRDLQHLQVLQNKACRIILCRNRFSHSFDLHQELNLPFLSQRRDLHLLVMMHKSINNQAPSYLARSITPVSERQTDHGTRGAETFLMELPLCRTVKGQGAFSFAGPRLWNSLPPEIRLLASCSKNVFQNAVIGWQKSNMINPT